MFDPSSRYYNLDNATQASTDANGKPRLIIYKRRRFVPSPDSLMPLAQHSVVGGERIDGIAATFLKDPTQYWRICDANAVMRPSELTDTIGRVLKIAISGS